MHKKCTTFPILLEGKQTIFSNRHILIKRSLNMIISQNKHSIALKLYIYATIAHNFNKYKQNADKTIEKVGFFSDTTFIFFSENYKSLLWT